MVLLLTAGLPDDFLVQTLPFSLNRSNRRLSLFKCGGFILSLFLNLRRTQVNDFVFRESQDTLRFFLRP